MRTGIVALALAFLGASATSVLAQETTGTITGRVIDSKARGSGRDDYRGLRLTLSGDLFNLFNQKTVLDYDNVTESAFASPNPDFGQPRSLADGPAIQTPFGVRLGVRYSF